MITTVASNYPKIANRPGGQALRRAISDYDQGTISAEELARVADDVTIEAMREQEAAGIDLITDGQIRWEDPITYLARGLEGFTIGGLIRYFDTNTFYRQPEAVASIRWTQPITVRDYQFARAHAGRPVKPVITGPYSIAKLSLSTAYADFRSFVLDVARALNAEMKALAAESPPVLQVDEPAITWRKHKGDWPLFQEAMYVLLDGVTVKTILRTDFGDLTGLADVFALPFTGFGLDFCMGPRNWELVPAFPTGKDLVLGIVDARSVRLEKGAAIHEMVARAQEHVDLAHLAVSPNTGLEFLPRETALAKLENLVRAVRTLGGVRA